MRASNVALSFALSAGLVACATWSYTPPPPQGQPPPGNASTSPPPDDTVHVSTDAPKEHQARETFVSDSRIAVQVGPPVASWCIGTSPKICAPGGRVFVLVPYVTKNAGSAAVQFPAHSIVHVAKGGGLTKVSPEVHKAFPSKTLEANGGTRSAPASMDTFPVAPNESVTGTAVFELDPAAVGDVIAVQVTVPGSAQPVSWTLGKAPLDDPCCVHCNKGKACGNSCIAPNLECHEPKGCACGGD